MLIISDKVHFSNVSFLNVILFSQLRHFGIVSFFNFGLSFLSLDAFRSLWCTGCKLILLADELRPIGVILENINSLNMILFSLLPRFGKLSFFHFCLSCLSLDPFRSIGGLGCKPIFLADVGCFSDSP